MRRSEVDPGQVYIDLYNRIRDLNPADIASLKRDMVYVLRTLANMALLIPEDAAPENQLATEGDIPESPVNADWNATSGLAEILNKPTIPAAQVNSDWNASSGVAEILNKPSLAAVATSGSYNDLSNKPTIPAAQVNSDWNASSGVAQILNKPSIINAITQDITVTSGSWTYDSIDKCYTKNFTLSQSLLGDMLIVITFPYIKPNSLTSEYRKLYSGAVAGTTLTLRASAPIENSFSIQVTGYH